MSELQFVGSEIFKMVDLRELNKGSQICNSCRSQRASRRVMCKAAVFTWVIWWTTLSKRRRTKIICLYKNGQKNEGCNLGTSNDVSKQGNVQN
jgi:hypothetical protein